MSSGHIFNHIKLYTVLSKYFNICINMAHLRKKQYTPLVCKFPLGEAGKGGALSPPWGKMREVPWLSHMSSQPYTLI